MKKENSAYGGFVVSKNVINGIPIKYTYREKSSIPELNGWNVLSERDDENYICEPQNFSIINAESMYLISPQMIEIYEAPYGTDLCWQYENGIHIGFYDLVKECNTTLKDILVNH